MEAAFGRPLESSSINGLHSAKTAIAAPASGPGLSFSRDGAEGADAIRFAAACLTDKQTASTLESALIEDGIALHAARSVSELAQTLERHAEIGILICDLHVDSEKGPAIYRALREKLPRARDTAVIFLATAASINDVISALLVEATDVLRKPPSASQLREAVQRAQRRLGRRVVEKSTLRQANELLSVSRMLIERLEHSFDHPQSTTFADAASGEFDDAIELPADGSSLAAMAATAREKRRVAHMIKARTAMHAIFGAEISGTAGWDMLLDLYQKALDGRVVSVSSLCIAAGVPATTALRRLEDLMAAGLVRRIKDVSDARRTYVELTEDARSRMKSYMDITV